MKVEIGITKWDSKTIHFDEVNIINITPKIPRTCKWQHQNLVFYNAASLIVPEIEPWSWERKGSRPLMSFTFPFSTSQGVRSQNCIFLWQGNVYLKLSSLLPLNTASFSSLNLKYNLIKYFAVESSGCQ